MDKTFVTYCLIALMVLATQWVGVILLAKLGKNGGWWVMLIGTLLTSFATFGSMFRQYKFLQDESILLTQFSLAAVWSDTLGKLFFFLGLVIFALILRSTSARISGRSQNSGTATPPALPQEWAD